MAEVEGSILIQIPAAMQSLVETAREDEDFSPEFFLQLAGLENDKLCERLDYLSVDGDQFIQGFLGLNLFGEAAVELLEAMLATKTLNWWASLWHEYGMQYYFACTASTKKKHLLELEDEDCTESTMQEVKTEWANTMPEYAKTYFKESLT